MFIHQIFLTMIFIPIIGVIIQRSENTSIRYIQQLIILINKYKNNKIRRDYHENNKTFTI